MRQRVTRSLWVLTCFAIIATLGPAVRVSAQDKPRYGGELEVRGWTITPSHYLNNQLDTVWLSE